MASPALFIGVIPFPGAGGNRVAEFDILPMEEILRSAGMIDFRRKAALRVPLLKQREQIVIRPVESLPASENIENVPRHIGNREGQLRLFLQVLFHVHTSGEDAHARVIPGTVHSDFRGAVTSHGDSAMYISSGLVLPWNRFATTTGSSSAT